MKRQFNIRSLGNEHSHQAIGLILPIQQEEFGVPIHVAHQPDLVDIEAYYQQPGGHFWGVFDGEELVGTIALLALGHEAAAIRKMFVKKEYRGKENGIAQALLEHLLDYCTTHNIKDVYLGTVGQMYAAHRFYERNGFKPIAATDLPSYFPRMEVDHLFYHLTLNPAT